MRVAFYAPLKGPDHPVPSGDRQMARLIVMALCAGGHEVELASTLRSFLAQPDALRQTEVERSAEAAFRAIEEAWSPAGACRPDIWFTYHPFYKAPDFLGPRVARRFGIPYATAEASDAPKRAIGPWASWHAVTQASLKAADVHFCFTDQDREGLERLLGRSARLVGLPPFIDATPFLGAAGRTSQPAIRLVAVAMMRPGDKMRSFAFLAKALAAVPDGLGWHLSIIGDGPARHEVEAAFAPLGPGRVSHLGQRDAEAVGAALRGADLYVWPGFNEAYGVSYLEAGAAGLPALAMRCGGIASVIRDGETGMLVPEGDLDAYTKALALLIDDAPLRRRLGDAAKTFVTGERTVLRAAAILGAGLEAACARRPRSGKPLRAD